MLADPGHVQLKRGNTAQALATWNDFLDCSQGVRSVRITDGLSDVAARLPSIPDNAAVQELAERAAGRA